MQRAAGVTLLLLLTLACASGGSRPDSVAAPTIVFNQAAPLFFGSGTSASLTLDIYVKNNATVPIRVREVEVRSPTMTQYTLLRTSRLFSETLAPGETRQLSMSATAVREISRFRAQEPLTVSAVVRIEVGETEFREIITQQFVGGSGGT